MDRYHIAKKKIKDTWYHIVAENVLATVQHGIQLIRKIVLQIVRGSKIQLYL